MSKSNTVLNDIMNLVYKLLYEDESNKQKHYESISSVIAENYLVAIESS
jgi:hypothetical protein